MSFAEATGTPQLAESVEIDMNIRLIAGDVHYSDPAPCSPHTPSQTEHLVFNVLDLPEQAYPAEAHCKLQCEHSACLKQVDTRNSHSGHSHSSHHSKHSRKHRHGRAASSGGGSCAGESLACRSQSFSLGVARSCSSSSSCTLGSPCWALDRPKSFTVAQLHSQRHRMAACSAARSGSPPGCGHDANCVLKRCNHYHSGSCIINSAVPRNSHKVVHKQRPASCSSGGLPVLRSGSGSCQLMPHRPVMASYAGAGAGFCGVDLRLLGSSACSLPQRSVLLAESVSVQDIGKGFRSHWYSNRMLHVYNGSRQLTEVSQLLKQVPQVPGLHLWLIKPPCGRQWVPVRLGAADNLQQGLAECLHADGSCGPPGFKQRVLLDLQCRGFAVQIRYRPMKASSGSVQQDLLDKLQRFDFALNDVDNNGCRPIELPDGRPVHSYPLVVIPMMRLYESLFVQYKLW